MSVSRKDLYSYVASMFVGVVKGIYKHMPTALSPDDIANGFIVLRMGNIDDSSEFYGNTYAKTRRDDNLKLPNSSISFSLPTIANQ